MGDPSYVCWFINHDNPREYYSYSYHRPELIQPLFSGNWMLSEGPHPDYSYVPRIRDVQLWSSPRDLAALGGSTSILLRAHGCRKRWWNGGFLSVLVLCYRFFLIKKLKKLTSLEHLRHFAIWEAQGEDVSALKHIKCGRWNDWRSLLQFEKQVVSRKSTSWDHLGRLFLISRLFVQSYLPSISIIFTQHFFWYP